MNAVKLDFERARSLHLLYKTKLRLTLYKIGSDPVLATDDHSFDEWLHRTAVRTYGDLPEFKLLSEIDNKLRKIGNGLLLLHSSGLVSEARQHFISFEVSGEELMDALLTAEAAAMAGHAGKAEVTAENLQKAYQEVLALSVAMRELDRRIALQVDETVAAQKRADESETKFRDTMRQAPVGITVLKGKDFIVDMANDSYLSVVDRTEREMIGKSIFDALPEVRDVVEPILVKVLATGEPFFGNEFAISIKRIGKPEQCFFNFVFQPLFEKDGDPAVGVIVVATEVTEQVLAKKSLEISENQFRNLVSQSQFAKAIFRGKDFIITQANETLLKTLWRREFHEVVGRKLFDVFPELNDQVFKSILEKVYATGKPYRENEALAYIDSPDGRKEYYLDYQYAPMLEVDGSVSGLMVSVNDVTDKVRLRQQISEAAERLSLATEGTRLATWDLNIRTRQVIHSGRLAEIFGFEESKILSHEEMRSFVHPVDRKDIVEKAFEVALKTGVYSYEARVIHPDQSVHWVRTMGKVLFDDQQVPQRMLGTMMDITEQKNAEQIIYESEKRYRDLIETMPVAIYTVDGQGYVTLYNKAAVRIWGREPVIGKDMFCGAYEMYSLEGELLSREEYPLAQAMRLRRALTVEVFVKTPEGAIRHVIASPQPNLDSNGAVSSAVNVLIDITDRKEVELALLTSEGKFETLADSLPQFVWTGDKEGKLNYFNQSALLYTALDSRTVTEEDWYDHIHPDERECYIHRWNECVDNGKEFLLEHRFRRFDGAYRWQMSRAIPQRDTDGIIQMWVGSGTDIHDSKMFIDQLETKVQQRTRELTAINYELTRTNQELAQFAYVASHDLQEPLRKIQTFATRILETEVDHLSERGKNYFSRMQSSSTRMQQLIIDLLAFSRATSAEKHFEEADLNVILRTVTDQLAETIRQVGAKIISDVLPTRKVIEYQFEQLFTNLLANSLKFTKSGVTPEIQIRYGEISGSEIPLKESDPQTKYWYISISDNGIGFETHYKERIFQVFQRLHGRSTYEGTGIGLAICKKIVDNHKGLIDAIGEVGVGAKFIIYVPLDQP